EIREQGRLLVDGRDAKSFRRGGIEPQDLLAVDRGGSGIGRFGAGEDPDERRLPSAVFSYECVDFPLRQIERYTPQRMYAVERLGDGGGFEKRGHSQDDSRRPAHGVPAVEHVLTRRIADRTAYYVRRRPS